MRFVTCTINRKLAMKIGKPLIFYVLSLVWFLLPIMAGQVVIDFSVPEYTEEGRLKHRIQGTRAVITQQGDADIENLRLDIFPENGQNMFMVSPACRFSRRQAVVESVEDVRIETTGLLITGTGFRWDLREGTGAIHSEVKVTIRRSEGLYRRQE